MNRGDAVDWLDVTTGQVHPGTYLFPCCEALHQVCDEYGWCHTLYAHQISPRQGPVNQFSPRPAGPRKGAQ